MEKDLKSPEISMLPEEIEKFLDSIGLGYNERFNSLYSNDFGCIRSSVVLTGVISHNFNLPIGYEIPGVRLAYGYSEHNKSRFYHAWSEVRFPDEDFYIDARFGENFNESLKKRIVFRRMEEKFFQGIGLTRCDEIEIPRLISICCEHPEGLEDLYDILIRFEPVLKINETGSIDRYLKKDEKLRGIYNTFLFPFWTRK